MNQSNSKSKNRKAVPGIRAGDAQTEATVQTIERSNAALAQQLPTGNPFEVIKGKKIVLIFDESNLPTLIDGKPLYMKFSHDLNLSQFAQAAIDGGARVYITTGANLYEKRLMWEFTAMYPVVSRSIDAVSVSADADIVASCGPELLLCKEIFPHAKIVAFFAAIHFVESPGLHDPTWLYKISIALRLHVDFVVTQHDRMAQLIKMLGVLTASVDLADRIISCPLGLWVDPPDDAVATEERRRLGLSEKVVIGNAGGIWRWTDYHTFLQAYITAVRQGASNLKLFITGITQPGNMDHHDYAMGIRNMLHENSDLVSHDVNGKAPIIFVDDWVNGGHLLKRMLPMFDIGLNLNNPQTEGWQSYRVRVLDYLSHNIPVMNTKGDWLSSNFADFGFVEVEHGNHASYVRQLMALSSHQLEVSTLKESQRKLAKALHYRRRYQSLLVDIIKRQPRTDKQPADRVPCMFDYARLEARRELRQHLGDASENMARRLLNII